MQCVLCLQPITDLNDSGEHLILNAIGGRKQLFGVLCRECNRDAGYKWDSELAAELKSLCILFRVKRGRGELPSETLQTFRGERYRLLGDGTMTIPDPVYKTTLLDNGRKSIQISAPTNAQAREMAEGLCRKHPELDIEEIMKSATVETRYVSDPFVIPINIGQVSAARSAIKSALCLAAAEGVSAKACEMARTYLFDDQAELCFGSYYDRDLVSGRPTGVPLHCVAVSNRGTDGRLLAYVEFFGFQRLIVCLADRYEGPEIHHTYAIDPTSGIELSVDVDLAVTRHESDAARAGNCFPPGSIEAAFASVAGPAFQK